MYGLNGGVNTGGVFPTVLRKLSGVGEHSETPYPPADAQAFVQDFEGEVTCLCTANSKAISSKELVARIERILLMLGHRASVI